MKKLLLSILFLLLSSQAWAAVPVIFYSDLTSGPNTGGVNNKGVYVTIWGKNFGATQGGSSVSVNGLVDNYPTWSDTMICFQLGSGVSTGNITVTTSAGTSNGIPFTVRSGNIYFIDPNAVSNGTGTLASPFQHIHGFYIVSVAGDTAYIRAGTITNEYNCHTGVHSICAPDSGHSGTAANPIALVQYPNETTTISATQSTSTWPDGTDTIQYDFRDWGGDYWIFSKFTASSTSTSVNGAGDVFTAGSDWRVVGNSINYRNEPYNAISVSQNNVEILGNTIHDSYVDSYNNTTHDIYVNAPASNFEIGWNSMLRNHNVGWSVSVYHNGPKSGLIHDNIIAPTNAGDEKGIEVDAGAYDSGDDITTTYGDVIKVYNNILNNAGIANLGGAIQQVCGTSYIYNNTFYGSGTETKGLAQMLDSTCGPGGGSPKYYFADNILYGNNAGLYIAGTTGGGTPVWGDFQVLSSNNYFGEGNGPTQDVSPINADPKFTTNFTDFHLQAGSPDIAAGYNTNSIVITDYDGLTRGNPPSIGAYEGAGSPPPPPPPPPVTTGTGEILKGSLKVTGVNFQ